MEILNITKSSLRKKLLSYFFSNPHDEYYLREIASVLSVDPGNLSRELKKMEASGVFRSREKGKIKLYSVNDRNPLYKELKTIVFKTIGAEGLLKKAVEDEPGIEIAFIYGSFAQKKEAAGSDIDLFIAGSFDEDRFLSAVSGIEKKTGREIHYAYWQREEITEKLKQGDSFIKDALTGEKIILKGTQDDIQALLGTFE